MLERIGSFIQLQGGFDSTPVVHKELVRIPVFSSKKQAKPGVLRPCKLGLARWAPTVFGRKDFDITPRTHLDSGASALKLKVSIGIDLPHSTPIWSDSAFLANLLVLCQEAYDVLQIRQMVPKSVFPLRDVPNFILDFSLQEYKVNVHTRVPQLSRTARADKPHPTFLSVGHRPNITVDFCCQDAHTGDGEDGSQSLQFNVPDALKRHRFSP